MKKVILLLSFLSLFLVSCEYGSKLSRSTGQADTSWAMLSFEKADGANPVLGPVDTLKFGCPVRGSEVKWAEKDVFNPAAVVRNDSLFLIYRAEDVVGSIMPAHGLNWTQKS